MNGQSQGPRAGRRWALLGVSALLLTLVAATVVDVADTGTSRAAKGDQPGAAASRGDAGVHSDADRSPIPGLLPNMRILAADKVVIDTSGPGRRLRFDATLVNIGDGPLELIPQDLPRCPRDQRHVAQAIYQDADGDGRFDRKVDRARSTIAAGCMLFHPDHDHWHIDATASYALTRADDTVPLVEQDKVSFCLRDSDRVRKGEGRPKHYGECARNRVQGITVGWGDLYDATLAGQALELPPTLPDGDYCLRLGADPVDLLRETDETDNGSTELVRIRGNRVTTPAAARCST
jgi:Lysyl oxidase